MDGKHYERQVESAINAGDTKEAIKVCSQWQHEGQGALNSPVFFMAKAASHAKRGNMRGVFVNMGRAMDLMRINP